jgi:hypothetical protein
VSKAVCEVYDPLWIVAQFKTARERAVSVRASALLACPLYGSIFFLFFQRTEIQIKPLLPLQVDSCSSGFMSEDVRSDCLRVVSMKDALREKKKKKIDIGRI